MNIDKLIREYFFWMVIHIKVIPFLIIFICILFCKYVKYYFRVNIIG